jgi:hypothetical protein
MDDGYGFGTAETTTIMLLGWEPRPVGGNTGQYYRWFRPRVEADVGHNVSRALMDRDIRGQFMYSRTAASALAYERGGRAATPGVTTMAYEFNTPEAATIMLLGWTPLREHIHNSYYWMRPAVDVEERAGGRWPSVCCIFGCVFAVSPADALTHETRVGRIPGG